VLAAGLPATMILPGSSGAACDVVLIQEPRAKRCPRYRPHDQQAALPSGRSVLPTGRSTQCRPSLDWGQGAMCISVSAPLLRRSVHPRYLPAHTLASLVCWARDSLPRTTTSSTVTRNTVHVSNRTNDAPVAGVAFGELLRQHRLAAGLTQASLAERDGLCMPGIQDLERGASHPHRDTLQRLIAALQLTGSQRNTSRPPAPRRHEPHQSAPANARESTRHNLPVQSTPFIGRQRERSALRDLLSRDDVRLVALTGPGGSGKTRLGLQVVAEFVDAFVDGVTLVDPAPTGPELGIESRAVTGIYGK
jgi:transcriptional regulator with XRE-family HTH domain